MLRSYVCRQCRGGFSPRTSPTKRIQWQPKATYISLRNGQPRTDTESQSPLVHHEPEGKPPAAGDQQGPSIHRIQTGSRQPGRYSRWRQDEDTLHQDETAQDGEPSDLSAFDSVTLSPIRTIEEALNRGDVRNAWRLFEKHYSSPNGVASEIPAPGSSYPSEENILCVKLLYTIEKAFCNWDNIHIRPSNVLLRCAQIGIISPAAWNNALGYLTDQLLWSVSGGQRKQLSRRSSGAILDEILAVWQVFFQCNGRAPDSLTDIKREWPAVPDLQSFTTRPQKSNDFGERLREYHPGIVSSPAIQFAATTLFTLFDESNQLNLEISDSTREETAPFIRLLTTTLAGAKPINRKHMEYSNSFKSLGEDFKTIVLDQIKAAPVQAMKKIARVVSISSDDKEAIEQESEPTEPLEGEPEDVAKFYLSQIHNAVSLHSHVGRLERVWQDVKVAYKQSDQKTAVPSLIYDALLSGFLHLNQPQKTVLVWNDMIANGIKPQMRTWTAMLEGCTSAKDLDGFNAVWERMRKTGATPDVYAWNTRIHGLISFRQIPMAFAAMDEMGNTWLTAQNAIDNPPKQLKGKVPLSPTPKVNIYAKPTVEVINGALSAFAAKKGPRDMRLELRLENIQKILQWAGQFKIKPNTYTYNTLLQMYIGIGDYPTTFKLLRQMDDEGIEGDLATYAMLIRAAFNSQRFDTLSHAEQADRVLNLFSELEADGLKLSDRIYSMTIDRLLKVYANFSAARTVIDHMTARNISPEPSVYASLITHYFQESPPNIEGVDSLMLQIFGPPRARTDKFLFDRVIEGYAANGEVGRMMSVLSRMSSHGKLPGYRALTAVVRALADARDWERARMVVSDVQKGEGVAKSGVTGGRVLEAQFFATVQSLGGPLTEGLAGEHLKAAKAVTLGDLQKAGQLADVEAEANEEQMQAEAIEEEVELEADDEDVRAEHAGYLSDEPEPKVR